MPTASIDVRAPASAAYEAVAADLLTANDDPDKMVGHRPLDDGPLRVGWGYRSRVVHERKLCTAYHTLDAFEPGRLIVVSYVHACAVSGRIYNGGYRWRFADRGDGTSKVTLHARSPFGWWKWQARAVEAVSVRRRLAAVQFQAERG